MKKTTHCFEFCIFGGSRQLLIRTGEDLRRVVDLEMSHWAMTLVRTDSIICDKRFLDIMDADKSGKIRCDEVYKTLKWMLERLSDLSGVSEGSDRLKLSALNREHPDGNEMYQTVQIVLDNLNAKEQDYITLSQISDRAKIVQNTLQNGDGVIPPGQVENARVSDCIRAIMALVGSHKDLSGIDGVNADDVNSFHKLAAAFILWKKDYAERASVLLPYGEKTIPLYHAMMAVCGDMDEFYKAVNALRFANLKVESNVLPVEKLHPDTIQSYLEGTYIANPATCDAVGCDTALNPLWRDRVESLFRIYKDATGADLSRFTEQDWNVLKSTLAPYGSWLGSKPTAIFDNFDFDVLCRFEDEKCYDTINSMIGNDIAVSHCLKLCADVEKLIVLQQHMMTFVNNFISLYNLFDENAVSMLQKGRLVMDGRVFTLCMMVPDLPQHKKIVSESDICVMYVNAVHKGDNGATEEMKLAVAVTSGHVRNIFIGKQGVFFTPDGRVWTAQVIDFVKQPVSISEAIGAPFYKFGEFVQQQMDKFFSSRSKKYEDSIAKDIEKKAATPVQTPATAAQPQQPGILPGSMVLMGGGIGIAAIGSSFAFITKSLQGISFSMIVAVLLGILLVFGAPILVAALIKLFRRNLSRFFEANGYAVNVQMRLSLRMGAVFTYVPKIDSKINYVRGLAVRVQNVSSFGKRMVWTLIILCMLAVVGYFCWPYLTGWFSKLLCLFCRGAQ